MHGRAEIWIKRRSTAIETKGSIPGGGGGGGAAEELGGGGGGGAAVEVGGGGGGTEWPKSGAGSYCPSGRMSAFSNVATSEVSIDPSGGRNLLVRLSKSCNNAHHIALSICFKRTYYIRKLWRQVRFGRRSNWSEFGNIDRIPTNICYLWRTDFLFIVWKIASWTFFYCRAKVITMGKSGKTEGKLKTGTSPRIGL